ncbi:hypothetical protein [Streptomyces erythrochromogenes]|uniref:hypothetical protein n=1 Tax=Streptomyces erythrochromogenes TaxID=285574 RepID=UPI003676A730
MSFSLTHPAGTAAQGEVAASAWPATAAAGVLAVPGLAAGPGDTAGIRVRTTSNPPHALYVIAAGSITPHVGADSAFAHLHPLIEAAARPCDGCGAEASKPCNPNCLPDPSTD